MQPARQRIAGAIVQRSAGFAVVVRRAVPGSRQPAAGWPGYFGAAQTKLAASLTSPAPL